MTQFTKLLFFIIISVSTLLLNGCTTGYFDPAYKYPKSTSQPKVPEISRSQTNTSNNSPRISSRVETIYSPEVSTYKGDSTVSSVIPSQEEIIEEAQSKAIVDIDPYEKIPGSSSNSSSTIANTPSVKNSSPAVQSLIVSAQSDLAVGKTGAAVSKLERGLRIESQNSKLWNLLAKAHFDQSNYSQTISMAKKAIQYAPNEAFIAKNWHLIQKAGLKSGDTVAVKQALTYFKTNP